MLDNKQTKNEKPNDGYGTLTIGKGKYGLRSKKCLKLDNPALQTVRGQFTNNSAEVGKMLEIICYDSNFGKNSLQLHKL